MKKLIYFLLVVAATVSCSKENLSYVDAGEPVAFCISGISSSRASSSVTDKVSWADGEQVLIWQSEGLASTTMYGIYEIADASEGAASLTYVSGREFKVLDDVAETFHAIYPYSSDIITADQGICLTESHLLSDMIYATFKSSGYTADFTFEHLFAKVQIDVTNNTSANFTFPLTVQMFDVYTGVTGLGSTEEAYSFISADEFRTLREGQDVIFDTGIDGNSIATATVYAFFDPNGAEDIYPCLYFVSDDIDEYDKAVDYVVDFYESSNAVALDGAGVKTSYSATLTDIE